MNVLVYGRDGAALKGAASLLRASGHRVGLRSSVDCRRPEHVEPCDIAIVIDGNPRTEQVLKAGGVTLRYLASTGRLMNFKPGRKPKRKES